MATALVWSERPEPNASSLKDCTYSSGLQGMVHGGYTKFPLGIYSVAEREALERSDDQPNETGASLDDLVVALKRRYGVTVVKKTTGLATALTHVGSMIIFSGTFAYIPATSIVRRWQKTFTGGHCISAEVRDLPVDPLRWLDPLAPNKYIGDNISVATAMLFAKGWGGYIEIKKDQFVVPATYSQAQLDAAVQASVNEYKVALNAAAAAAAAAQNAAGSYLAKIEAAKKALA